MNIFLNEGLVHSKYFIVDEGNVLVLYSYFLFLCFVFIEKLFFIFLS